MTIPFDCHFARAERWTFVPKRSANAGPTHSAVGLSEPANLDGAGGGNRTRTPLGTGF